MSLVNILSINGKDKFFNSKDSWKIIKPLLKQVKVKLAAMIENIRIPIDPEMQIPDNR